MVNIKPKIVIIAENALESLPKIIEKFGEPIFVTDRTIYNKYRKQILEILEYEPKWLFSEEHDDEVAKIEHVDVAIGFGGGRSIDSAKLLAAKFGLEWISVPTAASHDGIASEAASVSQDGYRYSIRCKLPLAVVADLSIISKAPSMLKRAGMGDILCKASSLSEWKMAHELFGEPFHKEAFKLVKQALEKILKDDTLETLVSAEIDAGRAMYLAGSSRPCSGTEHAISHAMERRISNLHGLQVIFATPLCLYYLEKKGFALYKVDTISGIMRERNLPSKLNDMKTTIDQFINDIGHALLIMRKRNRNSVLEGIGNRELKKTIGRLYGVQ